MLRQPLSQQLPCLLQHACRAASTATKPPISQKVRFIDQLRVTVRGGHGGGGSSALFGRTGHHPRAAGGNGASGGLVILRATKHLTGLGTVPLRIDAERGGNGGKQWMDGKKGADKIVPVPLGTLVYQLLEMQGREGMSVPHGVTALPHRATSMPGAAPEQLQACFQQYQPPMFQQQPSATCCAPDEVSQAATAVEPAAPHQQPPECQSQHEHSDRKPVQRSKRLFADNQLQSRDAHGSLEDQQQQPWASISTHMTAVSASPDAVPSTVSNEVAAKLAPTAAERLYEQLVKCQRVMTNSEKLHMLQTGRLPGSNQEQFNVSAASAASLPGVQEGSGSQNDESSSQDSSKWSYPEKETDSSAYPKDEWSDDGGEDLSDSENEQDFWGGWEQLAPHFSKQQVWSVLESQAVLLGELDRDGQELVVAAGGSGGRGNAVAASRPNRPATRSRSNGTLGQEVMLLLKLRLLADVVLVGLRNVGKSSLIAAMTDARAQIGSYAFTTLRPQLGIIKDIEVFPSAAAQTAAAVGQVLISSDWSADNTSAIAADSVLASAAATAGTGTSCDHHDGKNTARLAIADLPGLVPGAHAGKGRGTAFLAHLQKARCLALVIDMTGRDGQQQAKGQHGASTTTNVHGACDDAAAWGTLVPYTPQQQLSILQDELSQYDSSVMQMPMLIVANKLDALSPDAAAVALQQLKAVTSLPLVPISAKQGAGLHRLRTALQLLVSRA